MIQAARSWNTHTHFHDNGAVLRHGELPTHSFTLYAPYVAIPHIRIISREMAEAMHMSEAGRERER